MALVVCLNAASSQEPPSRLVIEDVRFAHAPRGNTPFIWQGSMTTWDLSGDGLPEWLLLGQYQYITRPIGNLPTSIVDVMSSGAGKSIWKKYYNRFDNGFTDNFHEPFIFLPSPEGLRLARISLTNKAIGLFDLASGAWKWVKIPQDPLPGIQQDYALHLTDIGDLDGDGYFDIGFTGVGKDLNLHKVNTFGVLSGRTMESFWMFSEKSSTVAGFFDFYGSFAANGEGCDSNSDGILDPLFDKWEFTDTKVTHKCLSGVDGSELWSASFDNVYIGGSTIRPTTFRCGDLNSDGTLDFVVYRAGIVNGSTIDPGYTKAVSGKTGDEIWHVDRFDWDPNFASGLSGLGLNRFFQWGDYNQDGFSDLITKAYGVSTPGGGTKEQLWVFSGIDGSHLGAIDFDIPNLEPWAPNPQYKAGASMLSDLNRDGWPDFQFGAPNGSEPGSHWLKLSVETLRMPKEVQAGQPLNFKVHIPRGAGSSFRILASSTFLHHGKKSHKFGDWDTQLGLDGTTTIFLADPATRGTLDSKGWYEGQLVIPASQGLEGTNIFFRGIVEDPSEPSGVRTMTTLSTVHVLP